MKIFKWKIGIAKKICETRRNHWDGNKPQIPILAPLLEHYEAKMLPMWFITTVTPAIPSCFMSFFSYPYSPFLFI